MLSHYIYLSASTPHAHTVVSYRCKCRKDARKGGRARSCQSQSADTADRADRAEPAWKTGARKGRSRVGGSRRRGRGGVRDVWVGCVGASTSTASAWAPARKHGQGAGTRGEEGERARRLFGGGGVVLSAARGLLLCVQPRLSHQGPVPGHSRFGTRHTLLQHQNIVRSFLASLLSIYVSIYNCVYVYVYVYM